MKRKLYLVAIICSAILVAFPATALADGNSQAGITPMVVVYQFDHYSQQNAVVNKTMKYVGSVTFDNSANKYSEAHLQYENSYSSSWSASITYGATVGGEYDAIVAKVNASVSVGGESTVAWSSGTTVGGVLDVPAGKSMTIKAYIEGTSSKGTSYYRRYDTEQSGYTLVSWGMGATVPSRNDWYLVSSLS